MDDQDFERVSAEREIARLKARYCRFIDTKRWEALRGLFVPEATFDGFGSAPPGSVRDDFVAGVYGRLDDAVSVHHCHMPDIVFLSATKARAVWAMEDYVEWHNPKPIKEGDGASGYCGFGFYEDEYVKTERGWRISFSRLSRLRIDSILPPRPKISAGWSAPNPDWLANA
jgi:hypothetical protein